MFSLICKLFPNNGILNSIENYMKFRKICLNFGDIFCSLEPSENPVLKKMLGLLNGIRTFAPKSMWIQFYQEKNKNESTSNNVEENC